MAANPIDEAVSRLEALQEQWCASTAGKPGARRIATFDAARGAQGEDDFDNEVSATRRCASDLALAIERIRALTAAQQQQGQAGAWVRYRSDGGIEGPVLDQHMDDIRRNSGAWTPLGRITAPPPSAPVGVAEALRDARHAGSLLANIAYNLAQDESLSEPVRRSLDDARKRWDLTTKDSRAALGPARGPHRRQGGRT